MVGSDFGAIGALAGFAAMYTSTAEEIATLLAYEFLRMGRYAAAAGPVDIQLFGAAPSGRTWRSGGARFCGDRRRV